MSSQSAPPVLVALLLLSSASEAQSKAEAPSIDDFIFFDYVEGGELRGGRVLIDPTNPLMANHGSGSQRSMSTSTTVISNGDPANRIDLVVVGDGYTSGELGSYANHVANILPAFFAEHPLDKYASYFNVHRVDVVSIDSGVDHDPVQGILKNTALDMGYWCAGTQRLLCVSVGKAYNHAGNAPEADQVLAIANSTTYGGAGYSGSNLGTLAGANGSAIEVALHEFGHSFANLADEYDYGGSTTYTGGEPSTANVSIFDATSMAGQMRKWFRWLPDSNVGTFEGARYSRFGIYRPTNNSLMRNLNRPLEQVNVEQFIFSIYRIVNTIDDATQAGTYSTTSNFFVDPLDPVSHTLDVQWFLDGAAIPGALGTTLDTSTLGLGSGPYRLSVEVVDNTSWVRDEAKRQALMRRSRAWTLDDNAAIVPYGCNGNPAGSLTVISGTPNPGATVVLGVDNPIGTSWPGTIPVVAVALAPDPNFPCGALIPGFGMSPILPGELLIDISPSSLLAPLLIGAPYGGPGTGPAPVAVPIPNDPSLLGLSVYAQGFHFDPSGSFGVRFAFAEAVEFRIGH